MTGPSGTQLPQRLMVSNFRCFLCSILSFYTGCTLYAACLAVLCDDPEFASMSPSVDAPVDAYRPRFCEEVASGKGPRDTGAATAVADIANFASAGRTRSPVPASAASAAAPAP